MSVLTGRPQRYLLLAGLIGSLLTSNSAVAARADQTLYDDALRNGWENWSWCTTDFAARDRVHSGENSIRVTYTDGWQGFYLHISGIDGSRYTALSFWIHGGDMDGRQIQVAGVIDNAGQPSVPLDRYIAGGSVSGAEWRQVVIPLADLRVADSNRFNGFWLMDSSGSAQPSFYLDDILLTENATPETVHLHVDAGEVLRVVDDRLAGLFAAVWDDSFSAPETARLLGWIGNHTLRYPGGSLSDSYHWETNTTEGSTYRWPTDFDTFAQTALQTQAEVYITVNYGSGTAAEAAAWVDYANRVRSYGFRYWEVGNEVYGSWEYDLHSPAHDPFTYALNAADYIGSMKAVDPNIKVGVVAVPDEDAYSNNRDHPAQNPRTGQIHYGWTPVMLSTLASLGVTPDFLIHHRYEQYPGQESDPFLLQAAKTWPRDAADLRRQLDDYLGPAGSGIELACTELNSVSFNPGKQTVSLVNGLYLADSVGSILQTEFNALIWTALRNGLEWGNNNSASLYGWRGYGNYGILSPTNDIYPAYYVKELLTQFARGGDSVVAADSDYTLLSIYAALRADGMLALLVINKSPSEALAAEIAVQGYEAWDEAAVFSYGIPQDEAARTGIGSPEVQGFLYPDAGSWFRYTFSPYSATVISLMPAH